MSSDLAHAALAISAAVFDSLWEGVLIAGAVWLGLRCLPQLGAATRYAIWLCALSALVLIPVITVSAPPRTTAPAVVAVTPAEQSIVNEAPLAPSRIGRTPLAAQPRDLTASAPDAPTAPAQPRIPVPPPPSRITISQSLAVAVAFVWFFVTCARSVLLLLDLRALAAMRRDARLWSSAHEYPVYLSDRVRVPIAAGFRHPAIILPASLVDELDPDAIETIVVHEVAHLRRYDVWTNALARVAEAFLALNPAAWFVMRRLSTEREVACDDWVVARTGSGDAFANILANLAASVGRSAPLGAPSALGSRHSIVVRIERLLDARPRRLRLSVSALTATLASLALIAVLLQSVSPVLAYDVHQPAVGHAAAVHGRGPCTVPDRGIQMVAVGPWSRFAGARGHQASGDTFELQPAPEGTFRPNSLRAATVNLTVNAAGHATEVTLVSPPRTPGVANDVKIALMNDRYIAASRNCRPIASTVRTAVFAWRAAGVGASVVAPVYPKGWSTRYPSACKVPSLVHAGVPAIPASLRKLTTEATFTSAVRVDIDAAGAVTKATVDAPSGQPAFDQSLLLAARSQKYPLTESSGFRAVRPAHATLAWNAVHGSDTYTSCKPLPTGYVWTGTFVASHTELFFPAGAFVHRQPDR